MSIQFDYYYGMEAEQFAFYQVPKFLFKDERFKKLSSDAKILYGIMLDRMSLPVKNRWFDEHNRVYIYYTTANIMEDLGCAKEKCTKVVSELKEIGLIEKKRQGLGKPDKIFVKNFISVEFGTGDCLQNSEVRKSNYKNTENLTSGSSVSKTAESGKSNTNNTENNNTDYNDTESNLITSENPYDVMREDVIYGQLIKENICYDDLLMVYPQEEATIEGIYELILETVLCQNDEIVVASSKYPVALVKSKFMKLNYSHVEYVLECLQKNTSAVKNMKKYLLAALFNAPSTMDSYYRAQVNHDMLQFADNRKYQKV